MGAYRLALVLAALLGALFAVSVLVHVLIAPEIGVRCAFTSLVNQFYPDFLYPMTPAQRRMEPGDEIVQIGDQRVDNWTHLVRAMEALPDHFNGSETPPSEETRRIRTAVRTASLITDSVGACSTVGVPMGTAVGQTVAGRTGTADAFARGNYVEINGKQVVRLVYKRHGEEYSVWCTLGPPTLEMLVPSIMWFFLKIGLFVVGAIVFWKRTGDRAAAQFFLLCIVSLGAYIGGYHWWRIVTQPLLLLGFMTSAILLPAVGLHFYMVFPRPKQILERRPLSILALIYGPPICFLLLITSGYLRIRYFSTPVMTSLLSEMKYEIFIYFGIAMLLYLASIGCLVHSLLTAVGTTERNQVKWILFGSLTALLPIAYSLYLAYMQQGRFGGGAATWPMFAASACVSLAFTISITRYRLLQLDQLISSGVIYFLISSLVGLIYYGIVFLGVVLVGSYGGDGPSLGGQALVVAFAALLLLVVLDLVRGRFKMALERHFRREKFQIDRTLLHMRQAIDQLVDQPALAKRLLHTAAELLDVTSGAVYLRHGQPPLYHLADALGPAPGLAELSSGCPIIEALAQRASLWLRDRQPAEPVRRQLQLLGGEVAQALTHEGELLGLLVLGPKEIGFYNSEDLSVLSAFAQLSVLAFVSAEGHRTIETLNRDLQTKVEKIAEQQRRILALQMQLQAGTVRAQEAAITNGEAAANEPHPAAAMPPEPRPAAANGVVGGSVQMRQLMGVIRKVAASQSAVLLRGESGTGKEVLARALHENSPRASQPFIKVHCAALAPGLLESELFGHVKGAFTNALRDKPGRFEAADHGTLFLDEIGDISLDVQTKLLRVLQEMTLERVGSNDPIKVDVRIIAATHQDLEELIRLGRFREDLFYRLNVFPIRVPPLRERIEDIAELAEHFLLQYGQRPEHAVTSIDDDALVALKSYRWPGNVRQLENVIERAVVVAEGPVITLRELPPELLNEHETPKASAAPAWSSKNGNGHAAPAGNGAAQTEQDRREREQLVRALAATGGNKAEAARALGVARSTLVSRLKRLGLS